MKPSGNIVLITGGGSGIGLALAEVLLKADNSVIVCGRDQAKLDSAVARLPGLAAIRADVTDAASRESLVRQVREGFASLNVLVNNAGLIHVSDVTGPDLVRDLEAEVATNLIAPVALTSLLLPTLRSRPEATIVNVTTGYVFLPSVRTAPYSATKTAMRVMTRALRVQFASSGLRIVEVMPPTVDTAMASHYGGSKVTPQFVAERIFGGLVRGDKEIPIGLSRLARVLARTVPNTAFAIMNRMEAKSARSAGQA